MKYIALLGRQPELSLAELEQVYGQVAKHGQVAGVFETDRQPDIQRLGGTVKLGEVVFESSDRDWAKLARRISAHYTRALSTGDGKVTLGISVYGNDVPPRDIQRTGLQLKSALKKHGRSLRLIPNDATALSTATSHHNKLGLSDNKIEVLVFFSSEGVVVAESLGTQNITAFAARDQARPKTDAFVGMLPPKLALMMVNLSGITRQAQLVDSEAADQAPTPRVVLDPFCGTGVVLQEAAVLGFRVYGSDLSEKMVDYSAANLEWLGKKYAVNQTRVEHGDATTHAWQSPINAVVAEAYLGQPFSAPPAPDKLASVRRTVDGIADAFLKNIHSQLATGTPLCLAVPAWRDARGQFTHLPVILHIEALGYEWQEMRSTDVKRLIYYREDQVVARQLLLLKTT